MPKVRRGEWQINYEVVGPEHGEPLMLIAGLGEQIGSVEFPDEQCDLLCDTGFRVIRIDNRDNGLSIPDNDPGEPDWETIMTSMAGGTEPAVPYALSALGDDAAAVIEAIDLESVTLVGASMGTAVARWAAILHPTRVRALMLVMGISGASVGDDGPQVSDEVIGKLMEMTVRRPRAEAVEHVVGMWRWLWGNAYEFDEQWVRERVESSFDRSYRPEGIGRNMAAVLPGGLWEAQLKIRCPTLVMHGDQDECCPPEHGRAIASKIPGSELWEVPGMGHSMHKELWPEMTQRIAHIAGRPRS